MYVHLLQNMNYVYTHVRTFVETENPAMRNENVKVACYTTFLLIVLKFL